MRAFEGPLPVNEAPIQFTIWQALLIRLFLAVSTQGLQGRDHDQAMLQTRKFSTAHDTPSTSIVVKPMVQRASGVDE